jgi:hypothetical protein
VLARLRHGGAGLVWLAAMSLAATAQAQNSQATGEAGGDAGTTSAGWTVSFEFLNVLTRGNDVQVGDVFTERQAVTGTAGQSRLDYGVTYDPIYTRMKASRSALVSAAWRGGPWGFGVRGSRFDTEGADEGRVASAAQTASTQSVTGVRMWDNSIVPVVNLEQASGFSPVTYEAGNELSALRVDGYVERQWIRSRDLTVSARFGVSGARIENSRTERQQQRAIDREVAGTTVTDLENDITLEGVSEADGTLIGPMLALAGESRTGRFRLDWLISHAALLGTAATSGTWTDIDDIVEVVTTPSSRVVTSTVLHGTLPIERDERVVVPVLDLHIRAGFQVAPSTTVGAGLLSSTWFGMPVAPAFSVPDDWTDVQGAGWRGQSRDITFTAVSIFATFGF